MVEGNRGELLAALEDFGAELDEAWQSVDADRDRPEVVADWFDQARAVRAAWPPEPGEPERLPLERENLLALGAAGGWIEAVESEVAIGRRPRVKSTS
jgi:prephenate dehydrogenase